MNITPYHMFYHLAVPVFSSSPVLRSSLSIPTQQGQTLERPALRQMSAFETNRWN